MDLLRGKIIPVMDLRCKFGLESFARTKETCIIVIDIDGAYTGLIVDRVAEVIDIEEREIEDPPSFGASGETDFILGMGKTKEKVIMLLDIGEVLNQYFRTLEEADG